MRKSVLMAITLCLLIALPCAWADVVNIVSTGGATPYVSISPGPTDHYVFLNKPGSFPGAPNPSLSAYQTVAINPVIAAQDVWANPEEAGAGAKWISFADTGQGGTSPANDDVTVANPMSLALFFQNFHLDTPTQLYLSVWADDTTGIYLTSLADFNTVKIFTPNFTSGTYCSVGPIGCIGTNASGLASTGERFDLGILAAGDYSLEFDAYQIAGDGYGLLYGLTSVPEPASIVMFGTLLVGVTAILRRRNRRSA